MFGRVGLRWMVTVLVLVLVLGAMRVAWAAEAHVVVDGRPVALEAPPVVQGGTLMVPLRSIFQALGATVTINDGAQSARVEKGDLVIEMAVGSPLANVNNKLTAMPAPLTSQGGVMMVALRFASEVTGSSTKFAAATNTYDVRTATAAAVGAPIGPRIDDVVHNASEPLEVGRKLEVVIQGEAGAQGSFDVAGVVSGVPLREEAPGRYVGDIAVTPGLRTANGKLLAHLVKNGVQTTREAARPVNLAITADLTLLPGAATTTAVDQLDIGATFTRKVRPDSVRLAVDGVDVTAACAVTPEGVKYHAPLSMSVGTHGAALEAVTADGAFVKRSWQFTVLAPATAVPTPTPPVTAPATVSLVVPADGSTVGTARPAIQIQFTQPVQPASVLITVDGQRVDATVTNNNTTVVGNLAADIAAGPRTATIIATDTSGRPISRSWSFTVSPPQQTTQGPLSVVVTTPTAGGTVHGGFHVAGTTLPNVKVHLHASLQTTMLFVTTQAKAINLDVTSDASGHFDFALDDAELADVKAISLELMATDTKGQVSPTVRMRVIRK